MNNNESILLCDRIWSVFPVTQPAFSKLLGLLEIKSSREVSSACVTFGSRSRLLINPDFVEKWCPTDRALVMLVLHELYHIALGHTRLWNRSTPALNLAFDAVINAQLCLLFPQPDWTALFRNSYPADAFPYALLRPPEDWGGNDARWLSGPLGAAHKALYTDTSLSYEALFALLEKGGNESGLGKGVFNIGRLIGGHGGEEGEQHDDAQVLPPDILEEVRGIVSAWPMVKVRSGRDRGDKTFQEKLALGKARRESTALIRQAVFKLADTVVGGIALPIFADTQTEGLLPYSTGQDRRAAVRLVAGEHSFFHRAQLDWQTRTRGDRVHVFLDVSGSMGGLIGPLYAALLPLLDWIEPRIHLFSSHIADINHAQLRQGVRISDGGTDIHTVTQHILENGVKRALILTDGWVGNIPEEHLVRLKRGRVKLHCVITSDGDTAFGLPAGAGSTRLPALN